jgi:spore maturation protein CgeB
VTRSPLKGRRIALIGRRGGTNIGGSFERAAKLAGVDFQFVDLDAASQAPAWIRRFNWHLRGHRPTRLNSFSIQVVRSCCLRKPDLVIVTGVAGINANALKRLRELRIKVVNYLTDDPWNIAHRAPWFFKALPQYQAIFSPRRANLKDLRNLGCADVRYLPFAYDPELHYPESPSDSERGKLVADVLFIGGADNDRRLLCEALAQSGLSLAIYGDYWDRSKIARQFWKGYADPARLRKATNAAKVCLCLPRKANRDGHTMRSYEVAAMDGIILAEDTEDHREIFGEKGALYFRGTSDMIIKAKWLATHEAKARLIAEKAHSNVTDGGNTYQDRLETMAAACLK